MTARRYEKVDNGMGVKASCLMILAFLVSVAALFVVMALGF